MELSTYIAYMRHLAASHYKIRHGQIVDGMPRKAFFRANSEMEVQQGIADGSASYPALVLTPLFGRYGKPRSGTDDIITGGFEIRTYCTPDDPDAIDEAQASCKKIGEQIIAKLQDEAEVEMNCAAIPGFDVTTVRWDMTGPTNENEYGCRFAFTFGDEAWEEGSTDFASIFLSTDEEEGGLYLGDSLLLLGDSVLILT